MKLRGCFHQMSRECNYKVSTNLRILYYASPQGVTGLQAQGIPVTATGHQDQAWTNMARQKTDPNLSPN